MASWRFVFSGGQAGQIFVFFVLAVAALLGVLAMALDVGYTYVAMRRLQNAADAAAIAAAREVGLNQPANALAQAVIYAQYNGLPDTDADPGNGVNDNIAVQYVNATDQVVTATTSVGISITVRHSVPSLLAGLSFTSTIGLTARAIAKAGIPSGQDGALSFAVCEADWQLGGSYELWGPQYRNGCAGMPANFKGVLDYNDRLDSSNVAYPTAPDQTYDWYIAYGYPNTLWVGDKVTILEGSMGQNAANALRTYITNHPLTDADGTYAQVVTPIFQQYVDGSPGRVVVKGFAVFKIYLDDVAANSAAGQFVTAVKSGSYLGYGIEGYGAKVVKLTR
ncbi:MAG: hypothetical protein HY331_07275 [Chloroflexi bacterium]|nr:hypothetical protein [Chloroflexota bacterium]